MRPGSKRAFKRRADADYLDLADEIERRSQGFSARGPFGRAYFTRVRRNILGGLHFAQQFLGVAADAVVMDFAA